jgi:hypothetical protein
VTFFREIEKSIQTHMEKQTNKQKSQKSKQFCAKYPMLDVSPYPTSNCTVEP